MSQLSAQAGSRSPSTATASKIWRVAAPLAVSFAIENIMAFTDAIVIGRLSPIDLAGFGLASRITGNAIYILCLCVVGLVSVFASEAIGRGNKGEASKALVHALWLGVILSIPVTATYFTMGPILLRLGQSPNVAKAAATYSLAASAMVIPYVAFSILRDFTAAVSTVSSVIKVVAAASVANLVLSWVLVHGLGNWNGLGIAGAGLAASIVAWGMVLSELRVVMKLPQDLVYLSLPALTDIHWATFSRYLRVGLPVSVNSIAQSGLWIAVQLMVGTFGASALAANQVVFSLGPFLFVVAEGLREALAIEVARDKDQGGSVIRHAFLTGVGTLMIYLLPVSALMIIAPQAITGLFFSGDELNAVLPISAMLLLIAAINQVTDGILVALLGTLKGLQDTRVPMYFGLFGSWVVGLPLGYVLSTTLSFGPAGLWIGLATGLATTTVLLAFRLLYVTDPRRMLV